MRSSTQIKGKPVFVRAGSWLGHWIRPLAFEPQIVVVRLFLESPGDGRHVECDAVLLGNADEVARIVRGLSGE